MIDDQQDLKTQIKARAESLGFPLCRITTGDPPTEFQRYMDWLSDGKHAGMAYLDSERHKNARKNPRQLFSALQSIIFLGLPYRLTAKKEMEQREEALICGYAVGKDYHERIPEILEPLLDFLYDLSPGGIYPRVFTDSAPILERELAARSGMGWIGKNSCLISPVIGSAFLLAEIFTDIPLIPDDVFLSDQCGSCERCIKACPTGCILPDRTIDAGRCISYHSIENRDEIPPEIMEKFSNQAFGCDICQVVCPWNRPARDHKNTERVSNLIPVMEIHQLLHMEDAEFHQRFGDQPVSRVKRIGMIRNLLICQSHLKTTLTNEELSDFINAETDELLKTTARWVKGKFHN
jgi:epoxyqueuosine reductase